MATKEELIQRWDAFLQKIASRFDESLAHAEEACHEQLLDTDYEYDTAMRSWSGMKAQIFTLIGKINEVWDNKVRPEMEAIGDFAFEEGHKGHDLDHRLIYALDNFQRKLEGELSQKFYDHAIQIANKKASCTQCNAAIEIKNDIFRAQYITCAFCNAVNTIEPETKFVKIGWGIVDNIAALKTQTHYEKMNAASDNIQNHRGQAPENYWIAYEDAHTFYWDTFFKERIQLNSDLKERYDADMARKKKEFQNYKEIQTK